jgi:hypothetical protein
MCGRPQLSHRANADEFDNKHPDYTSINQEILHVTENMKGHNPPYCSDENSGCADKTHVWWCGLVCGKTETSARRTSMKMSRARSNWMCCKIFLVQILKDVSLAHRRRFDSSGKKLKHTGSVHDRSGSGRPVTMLNEEIATIMRGQLVVSPKMSNRKSDDRAAMNCWNVYMMLKEHNFRPYRANLVQQLHGNGNNRRVEFRE